MNQLPRELRHRIVTARSMLSGLSEIVSWPPEIKDALVRGLADLQLIDDMMTIEAATALVGAAEHAVELALAEDRRRT